jgi:hypothetical protein
MMRVLALLLGLQSILALSREESQTEPPRRTHLMDEMSSSGDNRLGRHSTGLEVRPGSIATSEVPMGRADEPDETRQRVSTLAAATSGREVAGLGTPGPDQHVEDLDAAIRDRGDPGRV